MTKETAKIFDDGCGCIGTPTKFIKTGGLCGNCVTRLYSDWEELEENRDELLVIAEEGFLDVINNMPPKDRDALKRQIANVKRIIKEAKTLQGKETK